MQLAAMALSPLAALSLPLAQSESWQTSAREFADKIRERLQQSVSSEGFKHWAVNLDDKLTFMDWTFKYTGIDLSYIWDPELWLKFKEAVWQDKPWIFWNKLVDRIEYSESTQANTQQELGCATLCAVPIEVPWVPHH